VSKRIRISSGAAELACDVTGHGPPLVCLHAGVADRRVWEETTALLGEPYRVYAYDRRGFGETTYTPEAFSHVTDLGAVIDRTEAESVVVIGNSQGGRIALDYALDHPERVRVLILVAPAISGSPMPEDVPAWILDLDGSADAAWEAGDLAEANRLEAHLWLDGPGAGEGRVGGDVRALFLDMNGRALAAADPGEEIEPPSAWDRLEDLTVPTLVVFGDLDLEYLRSNAEGLTARARDARFLLLEGVAHLPMLEAPGQFTEVVEQFLDSN
jgi:pimeloyl-ACP methyl ester carboxylesterase